jgi:hypothetical protein
VNSAYNDGLWWLKAAGGVEASRGGKVVVSPDPVVTITEQPWQRFLFDPQRRAHPFFHVAEALWMLSGSNDLAWLAQFNKRVFEFSDDGKTWRGAYGHRWFNYFGVDQIKEVIMLLRHQPDTRRAVLSMWDPVYDLGKPTKDVPCNTTIYFRVRADMLEMTVCCRSNDAIWGCHGSNAVHFSFLHELVARAAGLHQGRMIQFSNNYHIYERHWPLMANAASSPANPYPYDYRSVPLFGGKSEVWHFLEDCKTLVNGAEPFRSPYFNEVAWPFLKAYLTKQDNFDHLPLDYKWAAEYWFNDKERKDASE